MPVNSAAEARPVSHYVRELKACLPGHVFQPAPSRLLWLPVHLAVFALGTVTIAHHWGGWPVTLSLSVLIGMSIAGLMFLGHEVLHGAVVRGRWNWLRPIVGWICFAPFAVSQQLWVVWHNRVHHANTNNLDTDPDMYPSLARYHSSKVTRWTMDNFALGGRRKRGVISLLLGFLGQSKIMLLGGRSRLGMNGREYLRTLLETGLAVALWIVLGVTIGLSAFVFTFAIPLVIADVIVMAYILTNHGLSPATETNDPLINSLTVTGPRWIEWLTLDFGYHVEHHLFPAMSARHARLVRDALETRWPERYQSMPLLSALHGLYRTGRVYKDATTLVDSRSGGEWTTLTPRQLEPG
jgi:fatty acid desaturase